jgi:hypothetical protein
MYPIERVDMSSFQAARFILILIQWKILRHLRMIGRQGVFFCLSVCNYVSTGRSQDYKRKSRGSIFLLLVAKRSEMVIISSSFSISLATLLKAWSPKSDQLLGYHLVELGGGSPSNHLGQPGP